MPLDQYTNIFGDGQVAAQSPDARGDFYDPLDKQQDFNYWQAKITEVIRGISTTPTVEVMILQGGNVSDAGSGQVNLAEGYAIAKDVNGKTRIVFRDAFANVALPAGFDDGRDIFVATRYKFRLDTTVAARVHKTEDPVTYRATLLDSYDGDSAVPESTDLLFFDSDPGANFVIWDKFTMTGTTFALLTGRAQEWQAINSINNIGDAADVDDSGTKADGDLLSFNVLLNKYLRTTEENIGIGITGAYKNFVMNPNGEIRQRIRHVISSDFSQAIDGTYTLDGWIGLNDDGTTISGIGYDSTSHSIQFSHNDGGAHRAGILQWFEHNEIKSLIGESWD